MFWIFSEIIIGVALQKLVGQRNKWNEVPLIQLSLLFHTPVNTFTLDLPIGVLLPEAQEAINSIQKTSNLPSPPTRPLLNTRHVPPLLQPQLQAFLLRHLLKKTNVKLMRMNTMKKSSLRIILS